MRTLTSVAAVCAALVFCTSPVLLTGDLRENAQHPRTERSYAYGPHPRQQLAVHWQPRRVSPGTLRPGLVVLHGGYWRLDRAPGWRTWSGALSARGLVVFDVDYRRNVDARWPAQRGDVLAALSWIKKRGARFGADPARLVLLGSSAGGHLATGVGAYGAGAGRVAGVIGLSPVADPRLAWRRDGGRTGRPGDAGDGGGVGGADITEAAPRTEERREGVRRNAALLAGCPPGDAARGTACGAVWRDMSAASHASGRDDPPMLLLHSARDFVPLAHSRALALAERASGMPAGRVTVVTVPGDTHGGGLLNEPGVVDGLLAWIRARTGTGGGGESGG